MLNIFIKGFLISGGLIMAIGAQNAFVLKQGLLRNHIFLVCLICFLCDCFLISLGVLGMGAIFSKNLMITAILSVLGGLFLFWYGLKSFYVAWTQRHALSVESTQVIQNKKEIIIATLAMTLLNPHVYLDTMLLIGTAAVSLQLIEKYYFLVGALCASGLWFFGLGYGARLLKTWFERPRSWQILEFLVGCMMWYLAFDLFSYFINIINNI